MIIYIPQRAIEEIKIVNEDLEFNIEHDFGDGRLKVDVQEKAE